MSVTTSDIVALNKNVGNPDNSYGTSTLRRLRHRFQSSSSVSAFSSPTMSPKPQKTKRRQRSRTIGRTKKRDDEHYFGDDREEPLGSPVGDEEHFGRRRGSSVGARDSKRRGKTYEEEREQFVDEDDDDIVLSSVELGTLSDEEEENAEQRERGSSESESSKEPFAESPQRERIESLSSGSGGGLRRNASSGSLRLRSTSDGTADQERSSPQKSEAHKHLRSASSGKFRRIANASKSAREKLRVPSRKFFAERRRLSVTVPKKYAKTADEALNRKVSVVSPRFEYYDKCACHGKAACFEQAKMRPGSDLVVGIPRGASYHDIEKQVCIL